MVENADEENIQSKSLAHLMPTKHAKMFPFKVLHRRPVLLELGGTCPKLLKAIVKCLFLTIGVSPNLQFSKPPDAYGAICTVCSISQDCIKFL